MTRAILILTLILFSCTPQKRCARKVRKAITMGCLDTATVVKRDTVFGWRSDTTFIGTRDTLIKRDTFTQFRDGVTVKTVVNWRDRIVDQVVTKRDTVIETRYKQVIGNVTCPPFPWLWVIIGGIGALFIGVWIGRGKTH
jgi:hypothetical protein